MEPDPSAILVELTSMLRSHSLEPGFDLSADTMLDEIPGLDSFWVSQVIAHLESAFRVEIDVAALEDLARIGDILGAIAKAPSADGSGGHGLPDVRPVAI